MCKSQGFEGSNPSLTAINKKARPERAFLFMEVSERFEGKAVRAIARSAETSERSEAHPSLTAINKKARLERFFLFVEAPVRFEGKVVRAVALSAETSERSEAHPYI